VKKLLLLILSVFLFTACLVAVEEIDGTVVAETPPPPAGCVDEYVTVATGKWMEIARLTDCGPRVPATCWVVFYAGKGTAISCLALDSGGVAPGGWQPYH